MIGPRLRNHTWGLAGLVMMATGACTAPPEAAQGPAKGSQAGSAAPADPPVTATQVATPSAPSEGATPPGTGPATPVGSPPVVTPPEAADGATPPGTGPDAPAAGVDPDAAVLPDGLRAPGFMFVFRGAVVLETEADPTWGTGPTTRKALDDATEGHRAVDPAKLPAKLKALEGSAVKLYGPRGVVCEGRLGALSLYGYHEGDEIPPDPEAGEDMLPSMPHLVAALTSTSGDCKPALWARAAELPAPLLFTAQKRVDAALAKRARKAAEAHPSYVQIAADYKEYLVEADPGAKAKPWPKFVAANLRVSAWTADGGGRKLVLVELGDEQNIRCEAYFTGSASMLFEVLGGDLRMLGADHVWRPQAILDVDADGAIEVLRLPSNELGGVLYSGFELADEVRFPSDDIGCVDADEGGEFGDEP